MGRFKIYDPKKLLRIEDDPHYGKCLLCEKRLKNIMGNIKRHYEQMHSVYVDANAKRGKHKRSKVKHLNPGVGINKQFDHRETIHGRLIHKIGKTNPFETPTTSTLPISNNKNNSSISTPIQTLLQNPLPIAKENKQFIKTTVIPQQTPQKESLKLEPQKECLKLEPQKDKSCAVQETKMKVETAEIEEVSKRKSDNQLPAYHSNFKNARLIAESDEVKIPCYSFINNIQINLVDSCHQLEFLKCLVETKSHVNIPLQCLKNENTFQNALKNWKSNFQFNYSPQTIGEHVDRMTKKLYQGIKTLVANRIIYLKLDIANNTAGNVMLLNIQFIKDFKTQVITLNVLELSDNDLADNLKKKILSTLERFRIDISNVFSIIKDNTNNVRRYGKICGNSSNTDYCQNLSHGFPGHAIHFAAKDIIELLNENISQSRDSVKSLQTQLFKLQAKTLPLLDNNGNWFSVYDMIESLVNTQGEVEKPSPVLVEVDWLFAKKFVEGFKPIVDTAIRLQNNEVVIMGDFYREWLLCEMNLKEVAVSNELALYLLEALRKRKLEFFTNPLFLAALYLDPRFCYMGSLHLNDKQKELAISRLLQIFHKLKTMHGNATVTDPANNLDINCNDRYDKLEKQIFSNPPNNIETNNYYDAVSLKDVNEKRIKELLEQLKFEERLPLRTNILEYWNMAKFKTPILAKLAEIALAAPASQSTLSRALNSSSIALFNRKLNESTQNIENLLLLKLNQDLVDKISLEN